MEEFENDPIFSEEAGQELFGDELPKMMELWLTNTFGPDDKPPLLINLKNSLKDKDVEGFKRNAHSMKGSSRYIGLIRMGNICEKLQYAIGALLKAIEAGNAKPENIDTDPNTNKYFKIWLSALEPTFHAVCVYIGQPNKEFNIDPEILKLINEAKAEQAPSASGQQQASVQQQAAAQAQPPAQQPPAQHPQAQRQVSASANQIPDEKPIQHAQNSPVKIPSDQGLKQAPSQHEESKISIEEGKENKSLKEFKVTDVLPELDSNNFLQEEPRRAPRYSSILPPKNDVVLTSPLLYANRQIGDDDYPFDSGVKCQLI